jgi:eukaryotic-like serine/threonine-protein kinase
MPLVTGARLGPYEIQSSLGAGGMGEVYRAHDTRLDRIVAIKSCRITWHPKLVGEPFEREARSIAALNPPSLGRSPVPAVDRRVKRRWEAFPPVQTTH